MNANLLPIVTDPSFATTHWHQSTLEGIQGRARRSGITVSHAIPDDRNPEAALKRCAREAGVALILSASTRWALSVADSLWAMGVHPLLVGSQFPSGCGPYSSVSLNHMESAAMMTRYLIHTGRRRPVFFGLNPASLPDSMKRAGFIRALSDAGLPAGDDTVVVNRGSIDDAADRLMDRDPAADAILCANDVAAAVLLRRLFPRGVREEKDPFVAGFGDTAVGRLMKPSLTTATLDYALAGMKAVELFLFLMKTETPTAMSVTIPCQIRVRESTGNIPFEEQDEGRPPSGANASCGGDDPFYSDPRVAEFMDLENVMGHMDEVDGRILQKLFEETTYESMSEQLSLSETAIKYRLRKMMALGRADSRGQLMDLIERYIGPEGLAELAKG